MPTLRSAMRGNLVGVLILCVLVAVDDPLFPQEGFTIADNQIRVQTRQHWRGWDVAVGAAAITPDGTIAPRFFRKRINAALDVAEFGGDRPGQIAAGTNPREAHFLIDGDPNTSWGPDLDASRENWWVQLHLGRLVVVDSVVVRFAPEERGEPFLQFEILGWRSPPPSSPSRNYILGTRIPLLWTLFRTDRPNRDQRHISVVPRTTRKASADFIGDPLDLVHVELLDTKGDRLTETSAEGYDSLPPDARGAVDYYRLGGSGRQTLTTRESYQNLPEGSRGRVRYFRRERPRLAEIEVWSVGDNLNLGLVEQGAITTLQTSRGLTNLAKSATDGNLSTGLTITGGSGADAVFFEDLGTKFWVEDLHFMTDSGGQIRRFDLEVSDGSLAPDGTILWTRVASQRSVADFRFFHMEPRQVRYLRAFFPQAWMSFLEAMVYGEGYVAEAVLTSQMIDLGARKGLVSIAWDAETPEGTKLELSTRTGNVPDERFIYHDSDGRVVTEDRYRRRLPEVKKGEITSYLAPGDDFSEWSSPYVRPGEEIRSPRNRRYLQMRAHLLADTTSRDGPPASLNSIRVELADLYTDHVIGEVWPSRVERIGEPEVRSFFLRPVFSVEDQAFDQIRITASAAARLEPIEVLVSPTTGADADRIPAAEIEQVANAGRDTLELSLPRIVRPGDELVEVVLRTTIHASSTALEAAVRHSESVGSWQIAEVGDATKTVKSETNFVIAVEDHAVLTDFRIEPAVFTPNGDEVNDLTTLRFRLNRLFGPKEVTVSILDLSGRTVRRVSESRDDPRGTYDVVWDGEGSSGERVAPGTYIVILEVEAASERAAQTRLTSTVVVAY